MDQVEEIREKIDIVSLISEYLPLKKLGRNFKTTCPFHSEKTPSFVVSPERQIWHCFGCQKGGDCFTFLMEYENLEFTEALRTLAKKAGVDLKEREFTSGISDKKEKIYKINRQAMEFYHYVLTKHKAGKAALAYVLEKRGIKPSVVETFMLGFAPGVGNALTSYLINKKHYSKEDILQAGLGFQRGSSILDFFIKRLMFPLFDHRGNVIGFSGRGLTDDVLPKYVNTRETLVYHKGNVFFGLNIAKDEIKKEKRAIIMEGEFDVISAFQEGLGNSVAVKGTALTENHARLIARFCPKVSLCFDSDKAGQEAIKYSVPVLEKNGLSTTVIVVPNGKDPDELLHKNPLDFKKAAREDINVYDYLLNQAVLESDPNSPDGKKKITEDLIPFFNNIENEVVKEHYLKKLAGVLDSSFESILRQSERQRKNEMEKIFPVTSLQKRPREEVLEEYLLALILQNENPKLAFDLIKGKFSNVNFTVPAYQKILDYLRDFLESSKPFSNKEFLKELPTELYSVFDHCFLLPISLPNQNINQNEEILRVADELRILLIKYRLKALSDEIKEKEKSEKAADLSKMHEEFSRLTSMLNKAKS